MRPIAFWLLPVVIPASVLLPSAAIPQEVKVTLASRYVDTTTFNDVFSHEPSLQVEASYDLNKHVYVSAYAYTGFTRPFADDSSEYGFEVGSRWEVGKATATLSAGRYANYQGQGFSQGDWYVKGGVTYKRVTASASVLKGVSDTVLLNVSYELPVTSRLTITPSVAYLTAEGKVNPALTASYTFSKNLSVGAKFVLPKHQGEKKRKVYGAVVLSYLF